MSRSRIAFIVTGSIAAYKACDALSRLVQAGHEVRAVATASALRFVGAPTLEGLTGSRVLSGLFEAGDALEHIDLTRWADLVLVCPATAHTINRFAAGLADDLPGALFLAHDRRKPFLIAPAMNPAMWDHPATRASVETLRRWGVRVIPAGEGRTACGETGEGRLAEPAEIVAAVEAALARPGRRLSVLVTGGGTAEPVDGVRVLTNTSTGRTGALLADRLAAEGHAVTHLRARGSERARGAVHEETFRTFADLDAALGRLLGSERFDVVIQAAAVGDYAVDAVLVGGEPARAGAKLASGLVPVVRLRPNPKLVDTLRARSLNPDLRVVAFKLTRGAGPEEAREAVDHLFAHSGADWVVHNDLDRDAGPDAFPAELHARGGGAPIPCATRSDLAEALCRVLAPA